MLASLDLHDIVVLADGRPELTTEIAGESAGLREYIRSEFSSLLADPNFDYLLASALNGHGVVVNECAARTKHVIEVLSRAG